MGFARNILFKTDEIFSVCPTLKGVKVPIWYPPAISTAGGVCGSDCRGNGCGGCSNRRSNTGNISYIPHSIAFLSRNLATAIRDHAYFDVLNPYPVGNGYQKPETGDGSRPGNLKLREKKG
jgi:hypothetical protein